MGPSAAVWDCRAGNEITKDWNGIDQVVLRNPQGASARVRNSYCIAHIVCV
jgi:glucose-6-phosphate 1-epimerase